MDTEEIIELAKQAVFFINDELTITSPFIEDICISPMLKEFAKLVAQKEREICADFVAGWTGPDGKHGCARALRGRSDGE